VDRDDLEDRGAGHFGRCITTIKATNPGTKVEVLIPDYFGKELDKVLQAGPDVLDTQCGDCTSAPENPGCPSLI